jgi:hypothetical protein
MVGSLHSNLQANRRGHNLCRGAAAVRGGVYTATQPFKLVYKGSHFPRCPSSKNLNSLYKRAVPPLAYELPNSSWRKSRPGSATRTGAHE